MGRELDKQVAEKIMGWTVGGYHNDEWIGKDGKSTGYLLTEHASQECPGFEPTSDWNIAFVVIQEIKKRTEYEGKQWSTLEPWHEFYDNLSCSWDSDFRHVLFNLTPTDICMAALKTLSK